MLQRIFVLAAVLSVAGVADSDAARRYKIARRECVEYAIGGAFSRGTYAGTEDVDFRNLGLKNGAAYGADLAIPISRKARFVASYARQSTSMDLKDAQTATLPLMDLTLNYVQAGFAFHYPQRGWAPYAVWTVGVNHMVPKETFESMTRVATGLGLGFKHGLSDRLGLRVQVRALGTYITTSDAAFCDPATGFCYEFPNSTWLWQGEFTGGLVLAF